MRRIGAAALVLVLTAGCGSWPGWPFGRISTAMLANADRLVEQGEYEPAVAAYDEFLQRYPDDSEAARARVSRETAATIVATRAEMTRLRQELAKLRDDLARREGDLARVRQEAERLRADLERLKQIDLRLERRGKK
jgi:TolA-binding protein